MLSLIIRQTNWSILGACLSFVIGFFLKIYLINIVSLSEYGKYVIGQTLASTLDTFLALGLPFLIIKYVPNLIKTNKDQAKKIAGFCLGFSILIGLAAVILICFFNDFIAEYIYHKSDINYILCLMSIYIPMSLFMAMIISLYRSFLKIKEIVIYGTVFSVLCRAILTFVIFCFTDNILFFVLIEIFVQILTLGILTFKFNKECLNLQLSLDFKAIISDKVMYAYSKRMFYTSVVAYFGGQILAFFVSIYLSKEDIAAYSVLLSIASITTILLINLNRVFAPVISKLFSERKMKELASLYKETTFIINFLTMPLVLIVVCFSGEILSLFGEMGNNFHYNKYLILLMCGGLVSLSAGSSGNFMIMANLEKKNLFIQIIKALILCSACILFIREKGLGAVVMIYLVSMIIVNFTQVVILWLQYRITPYSFQLIKLYLIGAFLYFVNSIINFDNMLFLDYVFLPILIIISYYIIYKNNIISIIKHFERQ